MPGSWDATGNWAGVVLRTQQGGCQKGDFPSPQEAPPCTSSHDSRHNFLSRLTPTQPSMPPSRGTSSMYLLLLSIVPFLSSCLCANTLNARLSHLAGLCVFQVFVFFFLPEQGSKAGAYRASPGSYFCMVCKLRMIFTFLKRRMRAGIKR